MTYNPNIPSGTDFVSSDISDMQVNFSQANTIMNADHYNFNYGTGAERGQHKQINFPEIPSVPSPTGNASAIYPALVNSVACLFFKNATQTIQLTGATSNLIPVTSDGYFTLPGGIIVQFGYDLNSNSGHHTITFTKTFPNNVYVAYVVPIAASTSSNDTVYMDNSRPTSGTYNKAGFDTGHIYYVQTAYAGGGNSTVSGVYWLAIGN